MYGEYTQQLNRMERKIDHAHELLHAIADGVQALADASGDNLDLAAAAKTLAKKTAAVKAELASASPLTSPVIGDFIMPNPTVDAAIAAMQAASSLDDSVLAFLSGIPAMIQAAVDAAIANGATAAELAPFAQLSTDLQAKTAAIQAALISNTPVTAAQAKAKKP